MAERNINIAITNKKAEVIGTPVIVCGNSDYTVTFTFDDEWNLTGPRTARFVYVKDGKAQHEDVVFSGNVAAVPILENVDFVDVGVFAGNLCTTTPARVRCKKSILCGSGAPHDPTPDVYDQIMELFNEMAEAGAFGATEAQAQQIAKNKSDIAQLDAAKAEKTALSSEVAAIKQSINSEVANRASADAAEAAARSQDVAVLNARMDSFTKLEEGSTTGDAELADARVGYDGTEYTTAGDAIRGQASALAAKIEEEAGQLSSEIGGISKALDSLEEKTYAKGNIARLVTDLTDVIAFPGMSTNASSATQVTIGPMSNYDSYQFYAYEDISIYVANNDINYYSICVLENPSGEWTLTSTGASYMNGSNAYRVRASEGNLPTLDNPLTIPKGALVLFTFSVNNIGNICFKNVVTNMLNKNILLNETQIAQCLDSFCKCKYKSSTPTSDNEYSQENIDIYIPTFNGYIKYDFQHCLLASHNADNWRIRKAAHADKNFVDVQELTTQGEWECAVKINGRNDFSGGLLHGDEVVNSIKFVLDGTSIDITTITKITDFKELKIIEATTLYDPADNTTEIATHGKEYIFTKDGLTINQSLKWLVVAELGDCYMAMLPVSKAVTDSIYTDVDFEPRIIEYGYTDNCKSATVFSDTTKFVGKFEVPLYVGDMQFSGKLFVTDNSSGDYNKMYYIACKSLTDAPIAHTTKVNEIWKTTTKYKLDVGN